MMQTYVDQGTMLNSIHKGRVVDELRNAGVSKFGLTRFDIHYLPAVIHPTEHVQGVVYGYNNGESLIIVATDQRVIALEKKPFYINQDDISYDVVSGVSFSHAGLGSTITLHTRIKDYKVHTLNRKAAGRFIHFIEFHCMRLKYGGGGS